CARPPGSYFDFW
nr:immunoglobulin heavy chain junction region [Mus musculus]